MIKDRRHQRILEILASEGSVEISELSRIMPEVSQVTLRRDITELAEAGALKRTHGGAVLPDRAILHALPRDPARHVPGVDDLDAVVLPPIIGRGPTSAPLRTPRCSTSASSQATTTRARDV